MGRRQVTLTIAAYLSDHNDEQDIADGEAWDDFCLTIGELAAEPVWADLSLMVDRG
jgi:hypothetical protein